MSRKPFPLPQSLPAVAASRLSLAVKLASRDGGVTKGSLLTNGFVEQRKSRFDILMRPGLDTVYGAGLGDSFANGQGLLLGSPDGTVGGTAGGEDPTVFIIADGPTIKKLPNKLTFTVQPSNVAVNASISPAVKVAVQDSAGTTLPFAADFITVAIDSNPGSSTLGGTTTVQAVSGVATFSNLTLDVEAEGYTLKASLPGLSKVSASFNVTAAFLTFNTTRSVGGGATFSNGNLTVTIPSSLFHTIFSSVTNKTTGKWYCEFTWSTMGGEGFVGLANSLAAPTAPLGADNRSYGYSKFASKRFNSVQVAYGASYSIGDVLSVLYDIGAGTLEFWKNGVSQGIAYTSVPNLLAPAVAVDQEWTADTVTVNYGATAFAHTPPVGYSGWTE